MILKEYGAELYRPLASYSELRIRDKNAWNTYSEEITKVVMYRSMDNIDACINEHPWPIFYSWLRSCNLEEEKNLRKNLLRFIYSKTDEFTST